MLLGSDSSGYSVKWLLQKFASIDIPRCFPLVNFNDFLMPNSLETSYISNPHEIVGPHLQQSLHSIFELDFFVSVPC